MVLRLVVLLFLLGLVRGEYIIHILYNVMDLITAFDAILTDRQRGQKLNCFCGNPMANNFFQT